MSLFRLSEDGTTDVATANVYEHVFLPKNLFVFLKIYFAVYNNS